MRAAGPVCFTGSCSMARSRPCPRRCPPGTSNISSMSGILRSSAKHRDEKGAVARTVNMMSVLSYLGWQRRSVRPLTALVCVRVNSNGSDR